PATVRLLAEAFGLDGSDRERFVGTAGPVPAPSVPSPAGRLVPAQLPPDVWAFTGRVVELDQLDSVMALAEQRPTAVVLSALWGTAGVGKTALAVHWAHRVADQFPDGQLYVNLRGFDPSG